MIKLFTLIYNVIEPIVPCYADHFPETEAKVYPYAEFKFPNVLSNDFTDENISDYKLLEIDIWHNKGTDIRGIEEIVSAIHNELKALQYNDEFMYVLVHPNEPYRLSLIDPVVHIQRRQLRYIVTSYNK